MAKNKKSNDKKTSGSKGHPDHTQQLSKLNRVEGQVAGIKKMIEERRYCPEIIQQVRATRKALAAIEGTMLESHLLNCVSGAIESGNKAEKETKISEVMQIFRSAASQGIDL